MLFDSVINFHQHAAYWQALEELNMFTIAKPVLPC